jgi:S-phase kinase-associated protein 1
MADNIDVTGIEATVVKSEPLVETSVKTSVETSVQVEPVVATPCEEMNDTVFSEDGKLSLILICDDGTTCSVSFEIANMSRTLKNLLNDLDLNPKDGPDLQNIPIPGTELKILHLALVYCKYSSLANTTEDKKKWDTKFVEGLPDLEVILKVYVCAGFLGIEVFEDILAKRIAEHIKGKMPAQIREIFNLPDDQTPEDIERIKKECGIFD